MAGQLVARPVPSLMSSTLPGECPEQTAASAGRDTAPKAFGGAWETHPNDTASQSAVSQTHGALTTTAPAGQGGP